MSFLLDFTPICDRNSPERGKEGNFINIIMAIYEKPTANIILNGEKLKSRTKQECLLTTFIQHNHGSPSHSNQTKRNKGIQIVQEEVKLSLFAVDQILYIENPKDATRKSLELINKLIRL